ncbi:hypothetical protein L6164_012512 [Bauhinia variegata]|uniref:Uncharacterized protein n=1 Tax=Bauhinia variegata TaxID=167791 RepID=A0ACB9PBU2_BAUVA|nr:hypothetical protein L6164_012512 [Bauhinia variegata]
MARRASEVADEMKPTEGFDPNALHVFSNGGGRFVPSEKVLKLRNRLIKFMEDHKSTFDGINHDLSTDAYDWLLGAGLTNLEYGYLCEIMCSSFWGPKVFNCAAPDTGNMEVLMRYGSKEQQEKWLIPLLEGKIKSGFSMTEPQKMQQIFSVLSKDKEIHILSMGQNGLPQVPWTPEEFESEQYAQGKTNSNAARQKQHSMILVEVQSRGVRIKRPLTVFGFDDAPYGHAEITFENVCVPAKNIILGERRGFEIAQARLGPGRLHHCMKLIGAAERGMRMMVQRA